MSKIALCIFVCLIAVHVRVQAKQTKSSGVVTYQPTTVFTVKNGAMIEDFSNSNPWMKDFDQSNLRDGLLIRLGQVLHAFPAPEQEKTWKGSLNNFVLEQVIKNKPLTIAYYKEANLASPFAIAFPNLSETEVSIFKALLTYFAKGAPEEIKVQINDDGGHREAAYRATPAQIGMYRFGYRFAGTCLALSRDPKLAASLAETCKSAPAPTNDLQASVDWNKVAAPLHGFLKKYIQTTALMQINAQYENHGFQLKTATVPWKPNTRLAAKDDIAAALQLLPGNTLFFTALPLMAPESLSREGVEAYLTDERNKGRDAFKAVIFGLPGKDIINTGILLSRKNIGSDLQAMSQLLNDSTPSPVSIKQLCGKEWVLLSTSADVYDRLAKLCDGKNPSLNNLRSNFVKSFNVEAQHRVFVNLPEIGENLVRIGWQKENSEKPIPSELQKTIELLKRLPQFYAGGNLKGDVMTYEISQDNQ